MKDRYGSRFLKLKLAHNLQKKQDKTSEVEKSAEIPATLQRQWFYSSRTKDKVVKR
jgi:outer membrane protein W